MKSNAYDSIDLQEGNNSNLGTNTKITINNSTPAAQAAGEGNSLNIPGKNLVSSIKNFFSKDNNPDASKEVQTNTNVNANTSTVTDNPNGCKQKVINILKQNLEVEKSYKVFFIVLSVGLAMICLSLMFLPVIVFSPQKFVLCFGLGSLSVLTSFLFMYGTASYFEMLFSAKRFPFTVLFLVSIILGIYFAYAGHYFISVICAAAQLLSLIIFTLSFIPGGSSGITLIVSMLKSPFTNMWMKIRGGSYLPS